MLVAEIYKWKENGLEITREVLELFLFYEPEISERVGI